MQTDPETQPCPSSPNPRPWWQTRIAGIVIGDVTVGLLYALGTFLISKSNDLALLGFPSFFLVPALGGLVASYVWRSLMPTIGATLLDSMWMTLVALLAAMVLFREGAICVLIMAPFFFVSVLAGALLGRVLFRMFPTRLQLSIVPLLALGVLAEPLTRADRESVITDEIVIRAPVEIVWRQLTSFPEIPSTPGFWLFRLGLPYPVATTAAGDFVNAERECIFSKGAIFKEKVVEILPHQKLTFEILESPPDPELVGHLTPHRGQFVLRANADGTTTLIGSTWYTLHVRPLWYFDLWTHHIFRAVHLRVMEDIRRRAESSP